MKCPKCDARCGWISQEKETVYMDEDGHVKIGDKSRWGQQIKMKCNNPDCDAVVNMYIDKDLQMERAGEVERTGAKALKDEYEKLTIKKKCESCGKPIITSLWPDITRDGSFTLRGSKECLECNRFANLMSSKLVVLEPDEIE